MVVMWGKKRIYLGYIHFTCLFKAAILKDQIPMCHMHFSPQNLIDSTLHHVCMREKELMCISNSVGEILLNHVQMTLQIVYINKYNNERPLKNGQWMAISPKNVKVSNF